MEPISASAARLAGSSLLQIQSDERLAELAALDNHAAFEAIVKRYRTELLRASRKLLPDAAAEDAVQQALLRAHQALLRNGPPERLRPWLYKIAVNAALTMTGERNESLPFDDERMHGVERPDEAHERRERLRSTVAAIQILPASQRRAIVARELEGHSHDEIASELGLTSGAARQLIHRARASLRSAATAVTPLGLLERLLAAGGGESGRSIAEAAAGGAGGGIAAKAAVATIVVGGLAGGAALGPLRDSSDEKPSHHLAERALARSDDDAVSSAAQAGDVAVASIEDGGGETDRVASGERREDEGGSGNEGPGHGEPASESGSSSGSGGSSGSGESGDSGSDSSDSGSSGSGSSGSESSGSGSSGSGSSGSDSSGSGSSGDGSSGSGSGSSGSASSGSGPGDLFPDDSSGSSGSGGGD